MDMLEVERKFKNIQLRLHLQCLFLFACIIMISLLFLSQNHSNYQQLENHVESIEMSNQAYFKQLEATFETLNVTINESKEDVANVQDKVDQVNQNVSSQNNIMAYQTAGMFAILGSIISFGHMTNHIAKMNVPEVQRKILAIMWMIPIYSVSSWLGLVFVKFQAPLSLAKDVYEAYVIYTFLSFLIAILGKGDRNIVIDVLSKHASRLKPPMRFPWSGKQTFHSSRQKAEAVLDQCQRFCMQFVFLRPIISVSLVIADIWHEARWDYHYPQLYLMVIENISIFFAFTGLLRFYHVVKDDLSWISPFSKFMCIKGVVFLTFWQGLMISIIANAWYEDKNQIDRIQASIDAAEWSKRAQSFLVCLEMFVFAITHVFVFPVEEWEDGFKEKETKRIRSELGGLALKDFIKDVKRIMISQKKQKIRTPDKDSDNSEHEADEMPFNLDDSYDSVRAALVVDTDCGIDVSTDQSDWSRIGEFIEDIIQDDDSENGDIESNNREVV